MTSPPGAEIVDRTDPRAAAYRTAVESGDADAVKALFAEHPQLSEVLDACWFSFGSPALSHAAGARDRALVDALMDLGADPEVLTEWENGPYSTLHRCVDGATPESLALAEHILSRGALLDLHTAAGLGYLDDIRRMLDEHPERVNEAGPDGATPLHLARNRAVAALLLDRGADIDRRCIDHKSTAAMWAAGNREDVMRFLVEQGTTPDLYLAALLDDVDLAERILDADPTAIDVRVRFGHSHAHVGFGDKYVWTLHGADTPLEVARVRGHIRIYDFLLGRSSTETRLLQAARRGDVEAMTEILDADGVVEGLAEDAVCEVLHASADGARLLMERGVDPNARDQEKGATALHHVAWRGDLDIARTLLDGGADGTLRDREYGGTPFGWAEKAGHRDMMALLRMLSEG